LLSNRVQRLLKDPVQYDELLLSAISVWEFCKLWELKKISIANDTQRWIEAALDASGLRMVPLTIPIAIEATTLPKPFHSDPADQIIVATARVEGATLITKDAKIGRYRHVNTYW
jgi:PIN domain nuclease of toxin-antitoxin system